MPDTPPPTSHEQDPWFRLGCANELLAEIITPESALNLGVRVWGPGYLVDRVRAHLDAEALRVAAAGRRPAVYTTDPGNAPLAEVIAARIPWPGPLLGGLWPGHDVRHDLFGAGRLLGFNDAEWAWARSIVMSGKVLVAFDDHGQHWVWARDLAPVGPLEVAADRRDHGLVEYLNAQAAAMAETHDYEGT